MNAKIMEHFGVELIGWPSDLLPICNPAQLCGCDQVQKLLSALTTKACHWKKLSEEDTQRRIILNNERHARGEQVYKPRKKTLQGTKKSAATVTSDASDNDNNSDVDDKGNSAV